MATDQTQEPEAKFDDRDATHLVEAALYVAGRPLDLKTIGSVVGTRSKNRVKALVKALAEEYLKRDGVLEILELEDERLTSKLAARLESADIHQESARLILQTYLDKLNQQK